MTIYSIKDKPDNESKVTHYTMLGDTDTFDFEGYPITSDETKCYAKKIYNGQFNYQIKIGLNGKIYNPMGMFSEGNHNKFLAKLGKPEWKFTKVNQKVFDLYLNFLKTKNIAWLNTAQRELT